MGERVGGGAGIAADRRAASSCARGRVHGRARPHRTRRSAWRSTAPATARWADLGRGSADQPSWTASSALRISNMCPCRAARRRSRSPGGWRFAALARRVRSGVSGWRSRRRRKRGAGAGSDDRARGECAADLEPGTALRCRSGRCAGAARGGLRGAGGHRTGRGWRWMSRIEPGL
jgi:hypothetical protein